MQPGSHRENPVPFGRTPRASARTAVRLLAVLLLLPLAFGRPAPAPAEDDPVPVVTLGATPSGGQNPGINGTFAFEVSATDNGTVERVTMDIVSESSGYQTSVLSREDTTAPYQFYCREEITEGQSYKARFIAYDSESRTHTLTTDAFPANQVGPYVNMTVPAAGTSYPAGTSVGLQANWSQHPAEVHIDTLEWFVDGTSVASDAYPIQQPMPWIPPTAGT